MEKDMSRSPYDFYPTPEWCYENISIDWSNFKTALEPCKGDGRILSFLEKQGIKTDWCEIQEGLDFFEHDGEYDLIFTNPPFSLAQEFIEKALGMAPTVIMLLRINFLSSLKRQSFWLMNPPDGMIVLSKRPSFTGKGTDSQEYALFIWSDIEELQGFKWIK